MKKTILNVKGVKELNKNEQAKVNGGVFGMQCRNHGDCQILNSLPGMEYERFFCFWGYCQIS